MHKEWTIQQIRDFVKKDYQSVSARIAKCLLIHYDELYTTPPPSPVGIDVEALSHNMADKWVFETNGHRWSNNDSTAGDNFDSYKNGFKAGYAASPQSSAGKSVDSTTKEDILEIHIHNVALLKELTDWHKGFIYQAMNKYASEMVFEYQKSSIGDISDVIKEYNKQIKEYEQYCQKLESGIKNFLIWLKEKRPSMTGHGAPIMILEDLLDNKTNDLIKFSTCQHPFREVSHKGVTFYCNKCKQYF